MHNKIVNRYNIDTRNNNKRIFVVNRSESDVYLILRLQRNTWLIKSINKENFQFLISI